MHRGKWIRLQLYASDVQFELNRSMFHLTRPDWTLAFYLSNYARSDVFGVM